MGISSRFIRKLLASKILVFGVWFVVLSPWLLLWFIQSPLGIEIWSSYLNAYIQQKNPDANFSTQGIYFDPKEGLFIEDVALTNGDDIVLFSCSDLRIEWGIRKGIAFFVDDMTLQSEMHSWGGLISDSAESSSEPFSWNGFGGISFPFEIEIHLMHP